MLAVQWHLPALQAAPCHEVRPRRRAAERSDRPWHRSGGVRPARGCACRPPTPIQFSGATSRKSAPACACNSSPAIARRSPRPAEASGRYGGRGACHQRKPESDRKSNRRRRTCLRYIAFTAFALGVGLVGRRRFRGLVFTGLAWWSAPHASPFALAAPSCSTFPVARPCGPGFPSAYRRGVSGSGCSPVADR